MIRKWLARRAERKSFRRNMEARRHMRDMMETSRQALRSMDALIAKSPGEGGGGGLDRG